jgi:arylsulfatase
MMLTLLSVLDMSALVQPASFRATVYDETESRVTSQQPNVIISTVDDVGFAQLSSHAGLVNTPNIDRVAKQGLRFTIYRTPPICSASRAAMLTGRNPHSLHMGGHAGAPLPHTGYDAIVPAEDGTLAAGLKAAGYVTAAFGKKEHLPSGEITQAGPFTRWPTEQGFDKFYASSVRIPTIGSQFFWMAQRLSKHPRAQIII